MEFEDSDSSEKDNPMLSQTLLAVRNLRQQYNRKKKKSLPDEPAVVVTKDPTTVSLVFKNGNTSYKLSVNKEDPFEVVKKIISKMADIAESLLQLKYDGIPLRLSDTPKSYGMEDDDVVNFEKIQETASKPKTDVTSSVSAKTIALEDIPNEPEEEDPTDKEIEKEIEKKIESAIQTKLKADEDAKNNSIKLSVRTQNQELFKFKIQKTDPFSKIIAAVASKQNLPPEKIKLKFEGDTLSPNDTPNDLDMENGDLIDLHTK